MPDIYRKNFSSRYEHSREHQILDYLGQRRAPVPPLVLSHAELGYLEMHHGGTDLHQWLSAWQGAQAKVAGVLAGALSALIKAAELDVWHVDIALRNFVMRYFFNSQDDPIWLIDFGNTICPHFALQKPLWMLPNHTQHPTLQNALIQDWQDFYRRNKLPEPTDWHTPFDVPKQVYQEDWTLNLHVESLPLKWCVTAHGAGDMLLLACRLTRDLPNTFESDFSGLLNLHDENNARALLKKCLHHLQKISAEKVVVDDNKTPRPRLKTVAEASHFTPPLANTDPVTLSQEAPPLRPLQPSINRGWFLGLSAALLIFGWWFLDIAYSVQRQSVSWLTLTTVGVVMLALLMGLLGCFRRQNKTRRLIGAMWLHGFGQILLAFELWVFGMPMVSVWMMALAPSLALGILIWL
jgi:hypothetical protein